jgi:hypothetical protein
MIDRFPGEVICDWLTTGARVVVRAGSKLWMKSSKRWPGDTLSHQDPREHSGNIQGTFRNNTVFREQQSVNNIQGTFREHSGNDQGTFRERSGNIQGTMREHSGNILLR